MNKNYTKAEQNRLDKKREATYHDLLTFTMENCYPHYDKLVVLIGDYAAAREQSTNHFTKRLFTDG